MTEAGWIAAAFLTGLLAIGLGARWVWRDHRRRLAREKRRMRDDEPERQDNLVRIRK